MIDVVIPQFCESLYQLDCPRLVIGLWQSSFHQVIQGRIKQLVVIINGLASICCDLSIFTLASKQTD